jgi:hypothetical protein
MNALGKISGDSSTAEENGGSAKHDSGLYRTFGDDGGGITVHGDDGGTTASPSSNNGGESQRSEVTNSPATSTVRRSLQSQEGPRMHLSQPRLHHSGTGIPDCTTEGHYHNRP